MKEAFRFLRDANSFVASSRAAIEWSAPHIYLSALPFAPKDSLVFQDFSSLLSGVISVETFGIDRHGGRLLMNLTGHEGAIRSVAYSPDGRQLASGSEDGTARIWDTLTGEETVAPLQSGDGGVNCVAFAGDGQRVVSGTDGHNVYIWSVITGRLAMHPLRGHSDRVWALALTSNGRLIASGSQDKSVRLWDATTGHALSVLTGHTDTVWTVAFASDGYTLASGAGDCTVRLWNVRTLEPQGAPLHGSDGYVLSVAFSPDCKLIAAGFYQAQEIRIWNVSTGQEIGPPLGSGCVIASLVFAPDGSYIASNDPQGIRFLDWKTGQDVTPALSGHAESVAALSYSLDRLHIASASRDRTIRIWDAEHSPDALYIASAYKDGTIRICTAGSRQEVGQDLDQPPLAHDGVITSMVVSPCGGFAVSGSADRSVRVWDMQTCRPRLAPLLGHAGIVRSVTISSDGRMIASASASVDHTVRLWNAMTGEAIGDPLVGHEDDVRAVAFSPDMRCLASGSDDCTIRIWDTTTRQPRGAPLRCTGWVFTVAFSPDSSLLAAGDSCGCIYLRHTDTGQSIYEPLQANDDAIRSVAFAPNGARIISGGDDKMVRIWDIKTRHQFLLLEGHIGWVNSVVSSPSGEFICSGSVDKTVRVWNAATGAPITILYGHMSPVISATFTLDGKAVVSCSYNGTVRVWDVNLTGSAPPANPDDPVAVLGTATLNHGWLVGASGELLLWVPADYCRYISVLSCTQPIIRHHFAVTIEIRNRNNGANWTSCWRKHRLNIAPLVT